MSVALNLAYAASDQLRQTIKNGFLSDARSLRTKYNTTIQSIGADIITLIDEDILPNHKEKIETKLESLKDKFQKESDNLNEAINDSQDLTAKQLLPYYIITSLFSILMLFLGGQEDIHGVVPLNELITSILYMTISLFFFLYLLFGKKNSI